MSHHQKYLKYKQKYIELKNRLKISQLGGSKQSNNNTFVNIDDISTLTDEPNEINAYGYELYGGNVNLNEVITTTTIEDMEGGGNQSPNESPFVSADSNSSIETSSIRGLDEISSLNDSSEAVEQDGGSVSEQLPPLSFTDSDLDSDTSNSNSNSYSNSDSDSDSDSN